MCVSLIRKESEKVRRLCPDILIMAHLLQPILRLMLPLFKLLFSTLFVSTHKNPTPSPAWLQVNTMTFAVLLYLYLETALKYEITITSIQVVNNVCILQIIVLYQE